MGRGGKVTQSKMKVADVDRYRLTPSILDISLLIPPANVALISILWQNKTRKETFPACIYEELIQFIETLRNSPVRNVST